MAHIDEHTSTIPLTSARGADPRSRCSGEGAHTRAGRRYSGVGMLSLGIRRSVRWVVWHVLLRWGCLAMPIWIRPALEPWWVPSPKGHLALRVCRLLEYTLSYKVLFTEEMGWTS